MKFHNDKGVYICCQES